MEGIAQCIVPRYRLPLVPSAEGMVSKPVTGGPECWAGARAGEHFNPTVQPSSGVGEPQADHSSLLSLVQLAGQDLVRLVAHLFQDIPSRDPL